MADSHLLARALADCRTLPRARGSEQENATSCASFPASRAIDIFLNFDLSHVHFSYEESEMKFEMPFSSPRSLAPIGDYVQITVGRKLIRASWLIFMRPISTFLFHFLELYDR